MPTLRNQTKMRRTRFATFESADAILTGDWHLRDDAPICRIDNFQKAQWNKVEFIANLQHKHQCPVIHTGDLFDNWKPSPALLSAAINTLPDKFWTILGNHDLPQHNLSLTWKTGVETLRAAKRLRILNGVHWTEEPHPEYIYEEIGGRKILIWHTMAWVGSPPYPGCPDPPANTLLDKYEEFDLIVTGHYHKNCVVRKNDRLLVNPGSLTRQTADQADYLPVVYLWYAENNDIQEVDLPTKPGVISREHIDREKRKDERIEAFVTRLNSDWQAGISFEENVERFLTTNKIHQSVIQEIKEILYGKEV